MQNKRCLKTFNDCLVETQQSYNILIDAYNRVQNFEKALQTYENIKLHNLEPDIITYTNIIDGLGKSLNYCKLDSFI